MGKKGKGVGLGARCVCVCVCRVCFRVHYSINRSVLGKNLTLYQPMTHICVMSSHKPIRIYMEGLILGVNTLYRVFCFIKLFIVGSKELKIHVHGIVVYSYVVALSTQAPMCTN